MSTRPFDAWAPQESIWSTWAKPVLFANDIAAAALPPTPQQTFDVGWSAPADESTGIVIDLPGSAGVWYALALARAGYRPVPLYNAVPAPSRIAEPSASAVDLLPVVAALGQAAPELLQLALRVDAPPAFMLDSNRRVGTNRYLLPGMFDNRSVSLTTDFPSSTFLQSHGIRRVVLVQEINQPPQTDLAHTLLRWQEGGIPILLLNLSRPGEPVHINVKRPPFYRLAFQRVLATLGLRRNPLGGFGGVIPIPSAG